MINSVRLLKAIFFLYLLFNLAYSSVYKNILESNSSNLTVELVTDAQTEADLYPSTLIIGLPSDKLPQVRVIYKNELKTVLNTSGYDFFGFKWINQQKIKGLNTATLKITPMKKAGVYFQNITIKINFDKNKSEYLNASQSQTEFLKDRIINWNMAKSWMQTEIKSFGRLLNTLSGRWLQFFLEDDGMFSIPYSSILPLISDISDLNPKSFSIFMSKDLGRSKTQNFNVPISENIIEIAIVVTGENDLSFDTNDEIIFYGHGPSGFDTGNNTIAWNQNLYFNSNSCWLFIPDDKTITGKRITTLEKPQSGILIDYGLSYNHIEQDLFNLEGSGIEWVANSISFASSQPVVMDIKNPKNGADITIKSKFKGHSLSENSTANHSLNLTIGSSSGYQIGPTLNWFGSSSRELFVTSSNLNINDGINIFYINNLSEDNNSIPHLDYFELYYSRKLDFESEYEFYSPVINQNVRFSFLGEKSEETWLWYLDDIVNPKAVEVEPNGYFNFSPNENRENKFIIFDKSKLNTIDNLSMRTEVNFKTLRNNDLQANYVIIGPEIFRNESQDLLELRAPSIFASIEQIYLEFSGGNSDPMGIRNFIQWTQENWRSPQPTCVLLLGDSGYDYRNITGQSSIIIPTIQVQSSRNYATDDLLATIYGNIPEIALGRYPARNESEVANFVEKVISIETNPELGPWRQEVTLVADDAARPEPNHGSINTGKSHTLNSEQLYEIIPKSIITNKLYLIEYPETSDESVYGVIKPDATQAFFNYLNSGTAIISYIGHGSPYQLAQEKLLSYDRGDLNKINTGKKLPLWIVGTCSFGYFDDPLTESFAEELIRSKMNAASMIIATSRPITVVGNERYTHDLFESIFKNNVVSNDKVGIILQSIKDGSNEAQYFHLFGDPAMKLPMPKDTLTSLSINPDTLKTLEVGSFLGTQDFINGSGDGFLILKDASKSVTREYEISSQTHSLSFTIPGPTLFRGQFTFSGQTLQSNFRIPQNISYSDQNASLIVYIYDNTNEGISSYNNIYLAGGQSSQDNLGPAIFFENFSGQRFENGDHFPKNQILIIRLNDPLGINLTNEIGHEITINNLDNLSLDIVTDNFYYDKNSITTGTLEYPVNDNFINLKVKAWDNANNPSDKSIKLYRSDNEKLKIYNVYNFPNPFQKETEFIFEVNQNFDYSLDIYSIGGRRIWTSKGYSLNAGINTIKWNGKNAFGEEISNGVYIYRIKIFGEETTITHIGKCARYR